MSNQWFRMYAEFASDPKVQSMSEAMQRRLAMLFCFRCCDVLVTLQETEIAFALRITEDELTETKALFLKKGFIDSEWKIINWEKRQYASDSSKERTRRYREKLKQQGETSPKRHSDALEAEQNRYRTEQSRAEEKNSGNTPDEPDAVQVIVCFDDALAQIFGEPLRRPWPTGDDMTYAVQFLAVGAKPDWLKTVFLNRMSTMHREGKKPPKGLSYFKDAVPEELDKLRGATVRKPKQEVRKSGNPNVY